MGIQKNYNSVKQLFINKIKMSLSEEDITKLKEKFAELDKDGSGKISLTELKAAIEKRGGKFHDEMFDMLDRDGDGLVTLEEYIETFKEIKAYEAAEGNK